MVSPVGIEPTTNWLKASCSTTELRALARAAQDTSPFVARQDGLNCASRANLPPQLARRRPKRARERSPHRVRAAESALHRDLIDRVVALFQPSECRLHADPFHETRRRRPDLTRKHAAEMSRTHRRAIGESMNRQIAADVLHDPRLHVANGLSI